MNSLAQTDGSDLAGEDGGEALDLGLSGAPGDEADATHERYRASQDLLVASRIQRSFLPTREQVLGGFRVSSEYRPAHGVGGDFYDVFEGKDGSITVVMGDVSGKGIAGALVMARVSADIRRLAPLMESPRHLIEQLNRRFFALCSDDLFVTAVCVTLDAASRRLTVCNAGHLLPLVRRVAGTVLTVGVASGPPIGVFEDPLFEDELFELELGDVVLLMTDGITEGLHSSQDLLGRAAIADLISQAPASGWEINRRILGAVAAHSAEHTLDDIAILALDLTADPPRLGAAPFAEAQQLC